MFALAVAGASQELLGRAAPAARPLVAWRARRGGRNVGGAPDGAKGLALLAVGSLGRGDLSPGSDLDLLLVHAGRGDVAEVAERIWYPIWDDPMPLDHSVRTLSQVGEAAESDLRVALGLRDAALPRWRRRPCGSAGRPRQGAVGKEGQQVVAKGDRGPRELAGCSWRRCVLART